MKIYLIPTPIAVETGDWTAPVVVEAIKSTTYYFVENERTARRFISSLELGIDIRALHFLLLDKKTSMREIQRMMDEIPDEQNIGIMSEAGCPGVADPGALLVQEAHYRKLEVIPLPGPSSILLALMASGFSGQKFTFNGYLPIDKEKRKQHIQRLEAASERWGETHIFMETPYRNEALFSDILAICKSSTWLCVAASIGGNDQFISTKQVVSWKRNVPDLHKKPTIFAISAPKLNDHRKKQ